MRGILLATLVFAIGCAADSTVETNTAFRRLVDQYSSYDECIHDTSFTDCYQTFTLCQSGRVRMGLTPQVEDGSYQLDGDVAIATFLNRTVTFDIEARSSADLPGRNAWEPVKPLVYDCD